MKNTPSHGDYNQKPNYNNLWLKIVSIITLVSTIFPIATYFVTNHIADRQYKEKSSTEYVEFVKGIIFDAYYANNREPRIPPDSVSNFIISKTVTTLKTLEKSNKQKELLDFMKQAKIGFLPIFPDAKSQDLRDQVKMMQQIYQTSECPLSYDKKDGEKQGKINNTCLLKGINLESIDLSQQDLQYAVLKKANLRGAKLKGIQLQNAILIQADLTKAEMNNSWLIDANLQEAKLQGTTMTNAKLININLESADLSSTPTGEKTNLTGSILTNSKLQGANFKNTILTDVNLESANLSPSPSGKNTDLTGANLERANLSKANLSNVDLSKANLKNAILTNANLEGADLTLANLEGAKFENGNIYSRVSQKTKFCQTTLPNGTVENPDCNPKVSVVEKVEK